MSVAAKVAHKIQRLQKGEPFSVTGFYHLGSVGAVHKALSRLAQAGEIARLSKGLYVRPKLLETLPNLKVTASAVRIAQVWAKEHDHILVNQGEEAAYRLGLQTQAPMQVVYWTSGPSREFSVGNERVQVRHSIKAKLRWANKPEGTILRALLASKPEAVSINTLLRALARLAEDQETHLQLVQKLRTVPLLQAWQPKLQELEQTLKLRSIASPKIEEAQCQTLVTSNKHVTLVRLLQLLKTGIYSGCIAIITDRTPEDALMRRLRKVALNQYPSVAIVKLNKEGLKSLSGKDPELALVYGLEQCDPNGPIAHAGRTALDSRRCLGSLSIIFLDKSAHKNNFYNQELPFYQFCDSIDQTNISDWV